MTGRIMKGLSGFYFVYEEGSGMFTCKAKGIFRKDGIKPLVGDFVEFSVTDEKDREGNIEKILPRKNELIRPAVSNIDQALYIIAVTDPKPNTDLLNRFLVMMEYQNVPAMICINKTDLSDEGYEEELKEIYEKAGYRAFLTSARNDSGTEELKGALRGKTTTVAGPSGVGKSTLTNILSGTEKMETGEISEKIKRGKNTTRHSECVYIEKDTYFLDTPGFSSMLLPQMEKEDLSDCFPEFIPYKDECRFYPCSHISEPDCGIKNALSEGRIKKERYDSYVLMYDEIKSRKKY